MDSTEMSVHQISRAKAKICKELDAGLVSMILGDGTYLKKTWDKRIELLTEVGEKLKDPQFVLERLVSLLMPIIGDLKSSDHNVRQAESALQELQSFFMQANEIHNSNSNPSQLTRIEEWALRIKEESHSIKEELNQIMMILEHNGQLMKNVNVMSPIANMLDKVVRSCSAMALGVLNQHHNQVQGYRGDGSVTYDRKEGQLELIFPPPSVHEQEVISQEQKSKEMTLTIRSVAGRLSELMLANPEMERTAEAELKQANPEMADTQQLVDFDFFADFPEMVDTQQLEDFDFFADFPADFRDDTCIIQNYKVSKGNADALREIFDEHPNVDENFGISHPDFRNFFMDSLAGLYKKISVEEDKLELKDITNMESVVRDMEFNGLHLSWLQKMLTGARERKILQELAASKRVEAQKAEQEAQKV